MTDQHLTEIGRITIEYSRLEWTISGFIWKLVSVDQRVGQTITSGLNFHSRVALLRSLFELLAVSEVNKTDVDALGAALSKAKSASTARNRVAHALLWLPNEDGELTRNVLERQSMAEWTSAVGSVKELKKIADSLKGAYEEVSAVMLKHFAQWDGGWASPMGPGTLWGLAVEPAVAWQRRGVK